MKYKTVIFDLDGTLLNTIEDISDSVNIVLNSYNCKSFSVEDYKYFVGYGTIALVKTVMEKRNIPTDKFNDFKAKYDEEYNSRHNNKTRIYPGINELLVGLQNAGLQVCVLSNKPHKQTINSVTSYFKDFNFDLVYGKKENFKPKPDIESAIDMINKLEVKTNKVLYVGDTSIDMITAKNAGFTSVGVLWGFRKEAELVKHDAKYIVNNPDEILKIALGN